MGSHKTGMMLSWRAEELHESKQLIRVLDLELGLHRAMPWAPYPDNISPWSIPAPLAEELKERLSFTRGGILVGQKERYERISGALVDALNDTSVGVIGIDTGKTYWEANHQAYLQGLQEDSLKIKPNDPPRKNLQPIEYATPNGRQKAMFDICKQVDKDLIIVHHERPTYVMDLATQREVPSGKYELDGFSHTLDSVDWAFRTEIVTEKDKNGKEWSHPKAQVIKSPVGDHVKFAWLPEMTYKSLVDMVMAMVAITETTNASSG
jgi:hypothetical protein